jgi:prolyl 4-hydroxylase
MTDPLTRIQSAAASGDPEAQYRLGLMLARQGQIDRADTWFRRAADKGHPGALRERGLSQLFGLSMAADTEAGTHLLRQAADAGDDDARYWLVQRDCQVDAEVPWLAVLAEIAARGHALALRTLGLVAASAGNPDAPRLLATAAAARDAHSAMLLETLPGEHAPITDPVALTAAVRAVALPEEAVFKTQQHHGKPAVATADAVFSALDCRHLIGLGQDMLGQSLTVHPEDGRLVANQLRTSWSADIPAFREDPWALHLQRRLCRLLDVPFTHAEPLSLLRYQPGQEYRPHRDYLTPSSLATPEGQRVGQRTHTVFVYLSDVAGGGETDFPELDVRVTPRLGRAVMFDNVDDNGRPDPRSLHAGMPVTEGEKWLGTLWIRERPVRR